MKIFAGLTIFVIVLWFELVLGPYLKEPSRDKGFEPYIVFPVIFTEAT